MCVTEMKFKFFYSEVFMNKVRVYVHYGICVQIVQTNSGKFVETFQNNLLMQLQ